MKPSKSGRLPKYCLHKPSNRGYARFGRGAKPTYFPGPFGSPESRAAYDRELAAWLGRGRAPAVPALASPTVSQVLAAYLPYAAARYRKNGKPTTEVDVIRAAATHLQRLYGATPAAGFGVAELEALRDEFARQRNPRNGVPWSRRTVNAYASRVRRVFRWAGRRKMIPMAVAAELREAEPVRKGSGQARETKRVRPAPAFDVGCVQLVVGDAVRAMVWLQYLTGMRPAEVCGIAARHVDRSGDVWRYAVPAGVWKLTHRLGDDASDEGGVYWIGPRAQAALGPLLDAAAAASPDASPFVTRQGRPYSVNAYRHAIHYACARLGVPPWGPNRLRHSHGTDVRRRYGAEAARIRLNHAELSTTEIYAEADAEVAKRIAREIG